MRAAAGAGVSLALHVTEGVVVAVVVDAWTTLWDALSHLSMQLFAKACQTWSHYTDLLKKIWNTLERVFLTTTAHWERVRRSLPPILANVAPPSPANVAEFAQYVLGLVWGAVQGLFGMVAAAAAIPGIVEMLESFVAKVGQSGFWDAVWEMLRAQWDGFAHLFTQDLNLGAEARGELLGSVLIGVILLVIEVLTGLAETGVALEFTAEGILRAIKGTGKLGIDAGKAAVGELRENAGAAFRLGKGVMHGFPKAVEGVGEIARTGHLPAEWGEMIGKLPQTVGKHLTDHLASVAGQDVQKLRNLRGLSAGVHGYFKGKTPLSELDEESALESHLIRGDNGSQGFDQRRSPDARIRTYVDRGLDDLSAIYKDRFPSAEVPRPSEIHIDSGEFRRQFTSNEARNAPAGFDRDALYVNPSAREFWNSPRRYSERNFESGWWSSSSEYHAIRHEVGHVAHERVLRERFSSSDDVLADARFGSIIREDISSKLNINDKRFKPREARDKIEDALDVGNLLNLIGGFAPGEQSIASSVSGYAMTKPVEFVPEVFAGALAGRTYGQDIWALYRKYMGPMLPNLSGE